MKQKPTLKSSESVHQLFARHILPKEDSPLRHHYITLMQGLEHLFKPPFDEHVTMAYIGSR
jgi:hypothetical protein